MGRTATDTDGTGEAGGLVPHVPHPALRRHVGVAYGYRAAANPTGVHRGLPSRYLTLVVETRGPLRVSGPGVAVAAHGVLGGLHPAPVLIDASVPQEGLQYGLSPLGAAALLGVPAGELRGQTIDLVTLLGAAGERLVDEVLAAPGWAARFAAVDAALVRRLDEVAAPPPEVAEAWRLVLRRAGRVRVEDLAASVGWSRRHLTERFRTSIGLTPVEALRVTRFETARRLLLRPDRPPLADVALAAGYADQPHLAREWRALAGCSVTTWLREELPFVQDAEGPAGEDWPP